MKYFCLIAALSISSFCFAQSPIITFITKYGRKTDSRDSALLVRTVTNPSGGSSLYGFTENFVTGEPFRAGKTLNVDDILPDGACTVYYPSGKKLSDIVYDNGKTKTETIYFPNGIIFTSGQFTYSIPNPARPAVYAIEKSITTCNDSVGNPLVIKGNGYFVGYKPVIDAKFLGISTAELYYSYLDNEFEEGGIKNGVKDDVWKGARGNIQYTEKYKDGKFISGESVRDGQHYKYKSSIEQSASFPGGIQAFYAFLKTIILYPDNANSQDIVHASFVVDKDGSLIEIKILQSPGDDFSNEAIRVLKLSPKWNPGLDHGIPLRQQFTVPVSFAKK